MEGEVLSIDGQYKASLDKNIFDDLVFIDTRNNKLHYKKKYLDKTEPGLRGDKEVQIGRSGKNKLGGEKHIDEGFTKTI